MDLTTAAPRSAKDKLIGLTSLKRTIDKAKAFNDGKLGEYHYDCPHDKPLFAFLNVDAETFATHVKNLDTDEAISKWLRDEYLSKKTQAEIDAYNEDRMQWHPDPGSPSAEYFAQLRSSVAPDRPEIATWFDLLDLDDGRPVPNATILKN